MYAASLVRSVPYDARMAPIIVPSFITTEDMKMAPGAPEVNGALVYDSDTAMRGTVPIDVCDKWPWTVSNCKDVVVSGPEGSAPRVGDLILRIHDTNVDTLDDASDIRRLLTGPSNGYVDMLVSRGSNDATWLRLMRNSGHPAIGLSEEVPHTVTKVWCHSAAVDVFVSVSTATIHI
jgi:hypothetical protein